MLNKIVVHYHEIALKKGNRQFFVKKLIANIKSALKDVEGVGVENLYGRLLLNYGGSTSIVGGRLEKIPGIANFRPVFVAGRDLEDVKKVLEKEAKFFGIISKKSFAIHASRADKKFELTSEDINRELGSFVVEKTNAKVDLDNPEITIFVELLHDRVLIGSEKVKGIGGLPVGSGGAVVSLLSGGIDSPVSSFMMMKRGCRNIFIHFHSFPYLDRSSQDKAIELAGLLDKYQYKSKLHFLPLGDAQKKIVLTVPEAYRVVVYRRLMIRIANEIAKKEKAQALVTGESLGQVASQTIENISVIENVSDLPILRPLIGMDKNEIIEVSQTIGTYQTSILHDQDCCQLFTPKHPSTRTTLEEIEKAEIDLDIKDLVKDVLERVEIKTF
ncbi:tRNA uracil 4-sulfurtransferase ThiI [Patescibacteria group bacterium]